jgi:hypothetical protein
MSGGKWQVIEGILKSVELALATHVDNLGTLNEDGLAIPPSAKAIFYVQPSVFDMLAGASPASAMDGWAE